MTTDLQDILKPLRDAAEDYANLHYEDVPERKPNVWRGFVAGARHALTEPVILSTPEELDALPVGAVILDAEGDALTRDGQGDWVTPGLTAWCVEDVLMLGPVELIRLPRETGRTHD